MRRRKSKQRWAADRLAKLLKIASQYLTEDDPNIQLLAGEIDEALHWWKFLR